MLEKIAQLSQQDAKDQLLDAVRAKSESEAMAIVKEAVNQAKLNANKEAKKIVIQTIQRTAAEFTIENTVSVFNLENDDMKGQIIGREGRNFAGSSSVPMSKRWRWGTALTSRMPHPAMLVPAVCCWMPIAAVNRVDPASVSTGR